MELGKINRLIVKREADISYILTDGELEIFLHKKEAERPYLIGEAISVFLYDDNQGRITASTRPPSLEIGGLALLEVKQVNPNYGAFLYYGMVKDLLLSLDDLPHNKKSWPKENDRFFVTMVNKNDRLFAKVLSRFELAKSFSEKEMLTENEKYSAYVMYILENGIVAFTENGHEIFVHNNNLRQIVRLGENLEIKIIAHNSTGNYSGTLIEQKEIMMNSDSQIILDYLKEHGGTMRFTDKTDAESISKVFKMSKSAFKRALGKLYREKTIELNENYTKLKGD
ncbi:MAG: S1-like domain-containing RNA-binding protein [Candidatus Izemoplasmatales bacterium]